MAHVGRLIIQTYQFIGRRHVCDLPKRLVMVARVHTYSQRLYVWLSRILVCDRVHMCLVGVYSR